ncbi:MAG: hypothetical protein SNJ64_04110 [Endomicrobiia bacterium]
MEVKVENVEVRPMYYLECYRCNTLVSGWTKEEVLKKASGWVRRKGGIICGFCLEEEEEFEE